MFPIARHDSIFSWILSDFKGSFKGDIKSNFTHVCRSDSIINKIKNQKNALILFTIFTNFSDKSNNFMSIIYILIK
jgi:hypothetical protein